MLTEADTCRKFVVPMLQAAGWDSDPHSIAEQRTITLQGDDRLLLTVATGTGKTAAAFQICWKLWNARWNRTGDYRRPRILYLADRNILVDQPKDGIFAPFGDARYKIESGEVVKSREMYFAIYQALAEDERRAGLFNAFPQDFCIQARFSTIECQFHVGKLKRRFDVFDTRSTRWESSRTRALPNSMRFCPPSSTRVSRRAVTNTALKPPLRQLRELLADRRQHRVRRESVGHEPLQPIVHTVAPVIFLGCPHKGVLQEQVDPALIEATHHRSTA